MAAASPRPASTEDLRGRTRKPRRYQPDRNIIGHLYIASGSSLRPVFWTTDWGKRWPCQYRSLLRIQEILKIHDVLTPEESLGKVDLDEWSKYAPGPRRDPRAFFDWAKVVIANEWGEKCQERLDGLGATTGKTGGRPASAYYRGGLLAAASIG